MPKKQGIPDGLIDIGYGPSPLVAKHQDVNKASFDSGVLFHWYLVFESL